jgi:ATP-dependent Clp protease ATP-binding subunit ClpA
VGKTELTLEFARYLFGNESAFRFDMSEFLHLDNVKLFMGDETGSAGRLGKVLSRHQRGVLLFDEIEKAHRLIWDLFLQMLDAARITLADHRTYNLSRFYIVCTSNIGSQQVLRPPSQPMLSANRRTVPKVKSSVAGLIPAPSFSNSAGRSVDFADATQIYTLRVLLTVPLCLLLPEFQ